MVTVVPGVVAVFEFATAHLDFFGVDDNDVFPGVDVWGVLRAMFAHQNHCDFACQATQGTVGGVDHVPLLIDFTCFGYRCLLLSKHNNSSTFLDVLSLDGENRPDRLQNANALEYRPLSGYRSLGDRTPSEPYQKGAKV